MSFLIVCDIDGTLFDNAQRERFIPADGSTTAQWDEFNRHHLFDAPIQYRIDWLNLLAYRNRLVYLTGRPQAHYATTRVQLRANKCPAGNLIMRDDEDHRSGAYVKVDLLRELLEQDRVSHHEVVVIEDDHRICDLLAAEFPGINVILVPSMCCAYLAAVNKENAK